MIFDRYQGDPKMILDESGADLVFKGGQPVMDQGLENAALISLHTREGWCGNVFARAPAQKIGSRYEAANEQPITVSALGQISNSARSALQWMIDTRLAADIKAVASNPTGRTVQTIVGISPPTRNPLLLLLSKHGINWMAQKLDPANLKV